VWSRKVNDFYEYLMMELEEIVEAFNSPAERARELCVLLSLDGEIVPETFFRLYVANLQIPEVIMNAVLANFVGLGQLVVECDCIEDKLLCDINSVYDHDSFDAGLFSLNEGDGYLDYIEGRISAMREDIL
jgi:hypothetical protein